MSDVALPDDDHSLLSRAFPQASLSDPAGLFRDAAPIRRWSRENAVVMGGGCALLLEVAHPLVAAGVARHSSFRTDPFGRLQRTLAAMGAIVFGSGAQAVAAARDIERGHTAVRGVLGAGVGDLAPGTRYSGRDPELMCWVWATLVWTTVRVHERLLGPVSRDDRISFHGDQARVACLLGIPAASVPATPEAFADLFDRFRRTRLCVTPEGRAIADALFGAGGVGAGLPGAGMARALAASLLPPELRDPFGISWSEGDEARLDRFADSVRRLRPD